MKIYPFTKEQKDRESQCHRKEGFDSKEFGNKHFNRLVDKHLTIGITLYNI